MNMTRYLFCSAVAFIAYVFHVDGNVPLACLWYVLALVTAIDAAGDRIAEAVKGLK